MLKCLHFDRSERKFVFLMITRHTLTIVSLVFSFNIKKQQNQKFAVKVKAQPSLSMIKKVYRCIKSIKINERVLLFFFVFYFRSRLLERLSGGI